MTVLMDDWDNMDYEYEQYMADWEEEERRAHEEWLNAQAEDASRYPEEEDWSEDDFPR